MISLTNIGKQFNDLTVVNSVNLTIRPGEIVGLLGPNGAGKTTTIRMIAGVLPQSSGDIAIDGKSYLDHEHELKQRIGYLPENNPLYEDLTVEEHLHFWSRMKNIPSSEEKAAIEFAVSSTSLEDVYYRFISELSKGYRQRVGLAQAILGQPDILLLDEPTEGLDPNQRRDIQNLLSKLKKSRTVIVSSHVLGEIAQIASRIVIIHQGKVVGDDTPENLVKSSSGKQEIVAEIVGKAVITQLKKIKGVTSVIKTDQNTYLITSKSNKDIRQEVFKHAVKQKWMIQSLYLNQRLLEDVFSELTE